jgi:hypothetical protein
MYPDVLLFIDGAWTPSKAGRKLPVVNPASGDVVGTVAQPNDPIWTVHWRRLIGASRSGAKYLPSTDQRSCARRPTCCVIVWTPSPPC